MAKSTLVRFEAARVQCTRLVRDNGRRIARDVPFVLSEDAPSTFEALKAAWAASESGTPFPIYSGGCDRTIYADPEANHMFRLWHDWLHVSFGADFSLGGEIAVARMHCAAANLVYGMDAARLMWIETSGQARHYAATGEFIEDQLAFAWEEWQRVA